MKQNIIIAILAVVCVGLVITVLTREAPAPAVPVDPGRTAEAAAPPERTPPVEAAQGRDAVPYVAPIEALTPEPVEAVTHANPPEAPEKKQPNFMEAVGEMMETPEFREAMAAQQKMMMDQMYGELFRALGLEGEDRAAFKDLLAQKTAAQMEMGMKVMRGEKDPEAMKTMAGEMKAVMDAADEEIRTFLGEEDYALYKDYEATQPERMQVDLFKQNLSGDQALSWEQEDQLIRAMHDERTSFDFSTNLADQENPPTSMPDAEQIESHFGDLEQLNQRLLDRARIILTPDQLAAFERNLQQQMSMQKAGLKMMQSMMGGGGEE